MFLTCHPSWSRFLLLAAAAAASLQSCLTLWDPIDGSPPGSPVPGILQARTLDWVAISFSNAWKVKSESEVAQSCLTLSDPIDCSPPGSSVHGIFQARVLEWGAIAFFRGAAYYHINRVIREGLSRTVTLDRRPKGNWSRHMKEDCFKQSKEGICPEVGICTFEKETKGPGWVEQIERGEDW